MDVRKRMEIIYSQKSFIKHYNKTVDHFLFLLAVGPILLVEFWSPFPSYGTWRQMFLCKLRFATRYRYISVMLLKDV